SAEALQEGRARQALVRLHETLEEVVLIVDRFPSRENLPEIGIGVRLVISKLGIGHRLRQDLRHSVRECYANGDLLFALPNRGGSHGADHAPVANFRKEIGLADLYARRSRAERFGRQASVKSRRELGVVDEGLSDVMGVDVLPFLTIDF